MDPGLDVLDLVPEGREYLLDVLDVRLGRADQGHVRKRRARLLRKQPIGLQPQVGKCAEQSVDRFLRGTG